MTDAFLAVPPEFSLALDAAIERIRDAVMDWADGEGCGCCGSDQLVTQAKKVLAEELGLIVDERGQLDRE